MALGEPFPEILVAAQQGAQWAWSRIYQDLSGPVTGYLTGRGGDEPDDLVSETFLQVARGIHDFSGDEGDFRSWVFVIAHRRLIDERRKSGRRPATVALEGTEDDDGMSVGQTRAGGDVEAEAMARLAGDEVQTMLAGLTPDQRDVVMLRIVGGLSLEHAAHVLGKPVGAVKALQHRAVKALQKNLFDPA